MIKSSNIFVPVTNDEITQRRSERIKLIKPKYGSLISEVADIVDPSKKEFAILVHNKISDYIDSYLRMRFYQLTPYYVPNADDVRSVAVEFFKALLENEDDFDLCSINEFPSGNQFPGGQLIMRISSPVPKCFLEHLKVDKTISIDWFRRSITGVTSTVSVGMNKFPESMIERHDAAVLNRLKSSVESQLDFMGWCPW